MPPPYRWRSAAENAALQASHEAAAAKRRADHRHCFQAAHWIGPALKSLGECDAKRLHLEGPTLVSMASYCLDRR